MDFAALFVAVEATRHDSRSALPDAAFQPRPTHAERAWAAVRRALSRAPAPATDRSRGALSAGRRPSPSGD